MGDIAPSPGRVLWVVPAMQRSAVCCDPRLLRRDTRAVPRIDLCFFLWQWSPALTISKVLLSICSMLTDPNPGYAPTHSFGSHEFVTKYIDPAHAPAPAIRSLVVCTRSPSAWAEGRCLLLCRHSPLAS